MLNTAKQKELEKLVENETTGTETIEEAKEILRVLGVKKPYKKEDN